MNPNFFDIFYPTEIMSLKNIIQITSCGFHTIVLDEFRFAYAFGNNKVF
jgi:alpha-tubulin suppressor-like RCC1 family protein